MRNFIGRTQYLKTLDREWKRNKSSLIAIYGRRRVGKSTLINEFTKRKKVLFFEGIEGEQSATQIAHFLKQLSLQVNEPHLADLKYSNWSDVFELLSQIIKRFPDVVVVFDELTWMAASKTRLVSLIKLYWDQHWKQHRHCVLILCSSIASWMVKNVVKSKALYGRISHQLLVEPLQPSEVAQFIGKTRGEQEVLQYLLCFGGIPRYLEEFDFKRSISWNIEQTCLSKSGFFYDEADKIFYNQFKETQVYKKIFHTLLDKGPASLDALAKQAGQPTGGGFKAYLDNLQSAGIIEAIYPIHHWKVSKQAKYRLADEFLSFDGKILESIRRKLKSVAGKNPFQKWITPQWNAYLGYAFERFCQKNRNHIAELLEIDAQTIGASSLIITEKSGEKSTQKTQLDLVFLRQDPVITTCEIKYSQNRIGPEVIAEVERRHKNIQWPKGTSIEKVLIANQEPLDSVRQSGYFHQIIVAGQLLRS